MPALSDPHEEAFARALARGLSPGMASSEAGYARGRNRGRERAARSHVAARVGALQWDEAGDARAMIGALMGLAGTAGQMRSAAAMVAARGLVAEAARLTTRPPERTEAAASAVRIGPMILPLSDEAWAAKYGHRE